MKVAELASRLARCNPEATIYTLANGVRYHPELIVAAGDVYISHSHEKRIHPGVEIVGLPPEVSQDSKKPENSG